jgi:excisionase family DNA binding protein
MRCAITARMFTNATPPLLSVNEVAKLLRLHPHSVYRKIHAGELPACRLGEDGALRVRADELEKWLAANAVPRGDE